MAETITIVLNTQAQTQGIQATVNGLQRVKNVADSVGTSLGNFTRRFVGGLIPAVSAYGLVRFTQSILENADQMQKASQRAGETVREFSQLAEVGRLAGVSVENLTQAAKALPEWLEKNGQVGKGLSQVLIEQADIFRAMPDSLTKTALAVDMFGRSGQSLIPLLNSGSAALREQMEEADRFGLIIGPKFAANAERFNDNLTRIWGIFRGVANIVTAALLPAMNDLAESFVNWVKDGDKHLTFADGLIRKFSTLASVVNVTNATVQSFFGALPAYLGALSGGAGLSEAAEIAKAQLKEITDAYEKRRKVIEQIVRQADPANPAGDNNAVRFGTAALEIEKQRFRLRENALELDVAKSSNSLSEAEREKAIQDLLNRRLVLLDKLHKLQEAGVPKTDETGGISREFIEATELSTATLREFIDVQSQLDELSPDSFFERFTEGFEMLSEGFAAIGEQVADVMVNGIRRSIDTVADSIWQVIDGTATWGELFQNVARNIVSDLIRIAIQEIFLDNLKRGIMTAWSGLVRVFRARDVAESNLSEAQKTPALAANSTLAAIESYGVAVAIGVAAIAAILASVGAFAEGGVVAGGEQLIRVNERGTEAVLNARATSMLGTETINALNAGTMLSSSMRAEESLMVAGGGGGENGSIKASFLVVDSMYSEAAQSYIASNAGRTQIIELIRNARTEIGIS